MTVFLPESKKSSELFFTKLSSLLYCKMLPLTQGRALELFDHDLPVYLLHEDGSETTVHDRKQITGHEGIFGIEKGDWENEKNFRAMLGRERYNSSGRSGR